MKPSVEETGVLLMGLFKLLRWKKVCILDPLSASAGLTFFLRYPQDIPRLSRLRQANALSAVSVFGKASSAVEYDKVKLVSSHIIDLGPP